MTPRFALAATLLAALVSASVAKFMVVQVRSDGVEMDSATLDFYTVPLFGGKPPPPVHLFSVPHAAGGRAPMTAVPSTTAFAFAVYNRTRDASDIFMAQIFSGAVKPRRVAQLPFVARALSSRTGHEQTLYAAGCLPESRLAMDSCEEGGTVVSVDIVHGHVDTVASVAERDLSLIEDLSMGGNLTGVDIPYVAGRDRGYRAKIYAAEYDQSIGTSCPVDDDFSAVTGIQHVSGNEGGGDGSSRGLVYVCDSDSSMWYHSLTSPDAADVKILGNRLASPHLTGDPDGPWVYAATGDGAVTAVIYRTGSAPQTTPVSRTFKGGKVVALALPYVE